MSPGGLVMGVAALLLHLLLSVAAAPVLGALVDRLATAPPWGLPEAWTGRPPSRAALAAAVRRPWRRLRWLMGKEPVLADNASAVSGLAPVAAVAATLAAATLVPSLCLGLPTGAVADLPAILALLVLARLALLAGALDVGAARPGLAAMSSAVAALLAVPGLVLAVATLALASGSTGLEAILAALRDGGAAGRMPPALLAAAALGLAALSAGGGRDLSAELAGPDLALFGLQESLQRLVWIELVTALLWPGSLAAPGSSPLRWLLALPLWGLRMGAGCVALGVARGWTATPRSRTGMAGAAALLGALAPLLLAGRAAG